MVKDDLGALKFGYAILQHTTNELRAEVDTGFYKVRRDIAESLEVSKE